MHYLIITSRLRPTLCGVGDHTLSLAAELEARGHRVTLLTGANQAEGDPESELRYRNVIPNWGWSGMKRLIAEVERARPDEVLVQWVPYLYGHHGANLALPVAIQRLRARGFVIRTMVHEPWVELRRPKSLLTGPVQRLAVAMIVQASERVGLSIAQWRDDFRKFFPWKKNAIRWIPPGCTIPVGPRSTRAALELPATGKLLVYFSPGGSGKGYDLVLGAWRQVRERIPDATLVVLGGSTREARRALAPLMDDARVVVTGYVTRAVVSQYLSVADLCLAPFTDGITTRRSSALAAMAHGLPVLTTRGHLYDRELFEDSPVLVVDYDVAAYRAATLDALADAELPARGARLAAFFEDNLSWNRIVERLFGDGVNASVPQRQRGTA